MKKFLCFFAILTVLIFVVSCGSDNKKSDDKTDTGETVSDDDATDSDSTDTTPDNPDSDDPDTVPDSSDSAPDNGDTISDNDTDSGDTVPDQDTDADTGSSESAEEGIYLGIIGFNYKLNPRPISYLTNSNMTKFQDFIDDFEMDDGTALYYADYTALGMMRDYTPVPQKLQTVALVTFTDGEDTSSDGPMNDPENYNDPDAYLNAIHNKIKNEGIHGLSVEAYSIGLKSGDTGSDFKSKLEKLASSSANAFEVSNMEEVQERFTKIAEDLYSVFKTINIDFKVLGNYSDGTRMRFSLDISCDHDENVCEKNGINSNLYIDATYRRSGNERSFDNFAYHGFSGNLTTVKCGERDEKGFYPCRFENLQYDNMDTEIKQIELWKNDNNEWKHENEALKQEDSAVNESKSSALIMLVLDCTTSLGNTNFKKLQEAGKDFIETLVDGGKQLTEDDPTTPEDPCDPNPCTSISNSTGVCTVSGTSYVCGCNSGYDWNGNTCASNGSSTLPECSASSGTPCKDSSTNYIWSERAFSYMQWQAAKDHCTGLNSSNYGGYSSGWHLPTISELKTIFADLGCGVSDSCLSYSSCWREYENGYRCATAYSNSTIFEEEESDYWSSSERSDNTSDAWYETSSEDGCYWEVYYSDKTTTHGVRCVRGTE